MNNQRRWEILEKLKKEEVVETLLKNRGIKTKKDKKEFFYPKHPKNLSLKEVGIDKSQVARAILRIKKAAQKKEMLVIYGDYDVDGISGVGIVFEALYRLSKEIHPHLPDRFSEGYGLNPDSVVKLKSSHPNLGVIITVDNGISANDGVEKAREFGVDVIILDHHHKKGKEPKAYSTIYTTLVGGAEIAWIFAREVRKKLKISTPKFGDGLELAALGTIADMLPLVGPNRSFAWHGTKALRFTSRPGLLALYRQAGIEKEKIASYEINYMISPRLNAAGRMENAIDSLRLICTGNFGRASRLAEHLDRINARRQRIQEEIILHARNVVGKSSKDKVLILAHDSYHEGVVGLAAAKLVEEFGRPAIVFAKGRSISKGSGRSIFGFDLVAALSKVEKHLISWGGHKAACGLTISTSKLKIFAREFTKVASPILTDEILERRLKIDMEVEFESLEKNLFNSLKLFEPTGVGNPKPDFATLGVRVVDARVVGNDGKHLKLRLEKGGINFGAIAFGRGEIYPQLSPDSKVDIAYYLEENVWNGNSKLELKIKDLKILS